MKNLAPYPKFRAFDSAGAPLSGGKVYTYAQGTSTPKIAYSDNDLTAQQTNPVILDSNGEANLFLDGLYKLIITDANDVQILSVDEVSTHADADAAVIAQAVIDCEADRVACAASEVATAADLVATNQDTIDTAADAVATAEDRVQTGIDAASASTSETNAELSEWESEASNLTSESYATKAEDSFVDEYTSDGDGTYTATPTGSYSALHWAAKAQESAGNIAEIKEIGATVAANAMTVTLDPVVLDFRSATLGSGAVNTRTISTQISLVISSGSTLGTINGIQSRIAVLAIDNAGTIELAAVNVAGGNDLSETGLITTVAEGGAGSADSANVFYSDSARTNVPYRVVGYVESTQATAGTWATAPSTIQGYGGQAFAAMSSIGYGQTWQDLSGSRALATTYYNATWKPITICVNAATGVTLNSSFLVSINGVLTVRGVAAHIADGALTTGNVIIPPGASYQVDQAGTAPIESWFELR